MPHKPIYKIMIIDHNKIDLQINAKVLQLTMNLTDVALYSSHKKALQYLKAQALMPEKLPDVIFLDTSISDIDGFEFMDIYNTLPYVNSHCQIIMTSSNTGDEIEKQKAEVYYNVCGIINKPLYPDSLKNFFEYIEKCSFEEN